MSFASKILNDAVNEFSQLPGIGKRTALRLILYLLKAPAEQSRRLGEVLMKLRDEIRYCKICNNITDQETCAICRDQHRDESVICVVEDIRDIIAIEATNQFKGRYHVLGGIISPVVGVGPSDLEIHGLLERMKNPAVKEIIMALSATMEGDTTTFYLYKKIIQAALSEVKFSTIARGVSIGDELEYADEATLGRSITNRIPLRY